ncbi:FtsK/SpoIIIE domain-containing protein [Streptomyces sp. ITFR-6]|uniref:FtsK/SpoIIIE domain-containing protein n=1 Tax=Streptomyces sp. ITFR-6 TaxID=3075197 RepID=UPI002889EF10|nr:FtsK/SpoIIIE domain-containing protein [Streptomyces sp. ITFR-6]WNI31375.1 FtsK/SpoIIIE domain-containing protein [Streptomyces sp. ITFR-6]
MSLELVVWLLSAVLCLALIFQPRWQSWVDAVPWRWYLIGYPATAARMTLTWRRLCQNTDLSVSRRPNHVLLGGDLLVKGSALRPVAPKLGPIRPTRTGLTASIRLHPGQTPLHMLAAAEGFTHAWRVHSVRVTSPARGRVLVIATASDPLGKPLGGTPVHQPRLLTALIGRTGDGADWVINFRRVPHWLIVGATRSGKSNWLATLVRELAPQPLALVGIDCKGGLELSPFSKRLTALATNRTDATRLLSALLHEATERMRQCRADGARSIWDLDDAVRPVPIVVLVDEVAELYLIDGSRDAKHEAAECSAALLRLGQLGAALGIHLVISAQRFGSELGPGATALRSQLGGRVCHCVHDKASAEMALGDLSPDAVTAAQMINESEKGVAIAAVGGRWVRARSVITSPREARECVRAHAHRTPPLTLTGPSLTKGGAG